MGKTDYWDTLFENNIGDFIENSYFGVYKASIDDKSRIMLPKELRITKVKRDQIISTLKPDYKQGNFYLYNDKDSGLLFLTDVNNVEGFALKKYSFDKTNRISLGYDTKKYFEKSDTNLPRNINKNFIYLIGDNNRILLGNFKDIKMKFPILEDILLSK